jgi:outer membrane protein OmpA-like peptidoglycan-associated protein
MRLSFAARLLAALALVAASGVPAAAQQASSGHPGNLVYTVTNLVWPAPADLVFKIDDLGGKSESLAGNISDLKIRETSTEIKIDLAADVLFDFDKSTLRPTARDALHQAASIIRDNAKGSMVRIDGYTDSKGSDPYNQRLSDRRAESVRNWFVTKEGLKDVNFATKGYGAKNPVAPNTKPDGSEDPDGRQKNRRVEITVKKS